MTEKKHMSGILRHSRRLLMVGFLTPLFACILLLSGCGKDVQPEQANIIFILADDLGYGDVGFLNPASKIPTPNLDRLAAEGILFTAAHAPAAVCTPTRYSILTGRYPWRSRLKMGVLWIWDPPLIGDERWTLGEMLQQQGYHTACIGKWHLGWNWPTTDRLPPTLENRGSNVDYTEAIEGGPLSHGFDYYFGDDVPGFPPHAFIENDRMVHLPTAWHEAPPGASGAMVPGWTYESLLPTLEEKALEYITERTESSKPFFLFFSLSAPHTPIAPAEEFLGKSEAGRYGDFVYQVDHTVGAILQHLNEEGIAGQTMVIFSSDNGAIPIDGENYAGDFGSVYAHGHDPNGILRGVKSDAWEGGHRIPLVVRWPGKIGPGRISDEPVSLADLMATLADLTGAVIPDSSAGDSHNLLPSLLDEEVPVPGRTFITQSGNGILSIQQGNWKLIMSSGSGGSWSEPAGQYPFIQRQGQKAIWENVQLFDLEQDPREETNLAETFPEIVSGLAERLAMEVRNGRSTPGPSLENDGQVVWRQVAWMMEPGLEKTYPDAHFTGMFSGDCCGGFTGGDGTYSVVLPDGRTAWIFGDTFIGGLGAGHTRERQIPMYIRNSVVVRQGDSLATLNQERNGLRVSFAIPPPEATGGKQVPEDSVWFWPGDGFIENGQLKIFYSRFSKTGEGMWDFRWEDTWIGTYDLPGIRETGIKLIPYSRHTDIHFGHAVLEADQHTYVYGLGDGKPHVARYRSGKLDDPWEFLGNGGWSGDPADALPMADIDGSEQFTVFATNGIYILVTQLGWLSNEICSFTSSTPYGPWHNRQVLYRTPLPDSTDRLFTYNALAHPQFTVNGMLLVSYNMNSLELEDHFRNAAIYRPRFIRVPVDKVLPKEHPQENRSLK